MRTADRRCLLPTEIGVVAIVQDFAIHLVRRDDGFNRLYAKVRKVKGLDSSLRDLGSLRTTNTNERRYYDWRVFLGRVFEKLTVASIVYLALQSFDGQDHILFG